MGQIDSISTQLQDLFGILGLCSQFYDQPKCYNVLWEKVSEFFASLICSQTQNEGLSHETSKINVNMKVAEMLE